MPSSPRDLEPDGFPSFFRFWARSRDLCSAFSLVKCLSSIDSEDGGTPPKFADFPAGVTASPEMSGTGASELFGYFPSSTMDQHLIVRINKTSGAFDTTFKLAPLPAQPNAWAFAHWGGRYYQFVTSNGKNQVRRFNPATQTNDVVQDSTSYRIVGAGVSTCAPLILG